MANVFSIRIGPDIITTKEELWAQLNIDEVSTPRALQILEANAANPGMITELPYFMRSAVLCGCVERIRKYHEVATHGISAEVEELFRFIGPYQSQVLHRAMLDAYGFDMAADVYSQAFKKSGQPSLLTRVSILNAAPPEWIEKFEGQGQDITFLHSSHPALNSEGERQWFDGITHTLTWNGEETIWAAHPMMYGFHISPRTDAILDIDTTGMPPRLLQIYHALATMAAERTLPAIEEAIEKTRTFADRKIMDLTQLLNPGSQMEQAVIDHMIPDVDSNVPFSDTPTFLFRIQTVLDERGIKPLAGFAASVREERAVRPGAVLHNRS